MIPAYACSIAPSTFEENVRDASFAGVVEAISVGDGFNRHPPVPPYVVTEVPPTPIASVTRERGLQLETPTVAAPPSPSKTPSPSFHPELIGQSAIAKVVEQARGTARAEVEIDAEARRVYERQLREREAGRTLSSCGLLGPPLYDVGARYLVVLNAYGGPHLYTARRLPIAGSDVLLGGGNGSVDMSEATYRRYFSGINAEVYTQDYGDGTSRRLATLKAERVPLVSMMAMLRAETRIAPPETGSAGLAANR